MAPVIKLNDKTIDIDVTGMSKLSDIAEKIAHDFFDPKEIVTEVYINGALVEEVAIASVGETLLSDVKTVSFNTIKDPGKQVISLLGKMKDYLEGFSGGIENVADQFRMGSPEEANKFLFQAIEGISAFVELLHTVRLFTKSDLAHLTFENESLEERENRLLEVTKKMQASQEEKDWITVADLLEYELSPLMTEWKGMIPTIEDEVLKSG